MARISGIDLPNKAVKIGLTYIFGIGQSAALDICDKTGIEVKNLLKKVTI